MIAKFAAAAALAGALALPQAALAKDHGRHDRDRAYGYDRACPPGLAKKRNGCMAPGQWKKGDRYPSEWTRYYSRYEALPYSYRNRYSYNPDYRYVYRDNRVYVVNPLTQAILDIIGL